MFNSVWADPNEQMMNELSQRRWPIMVLAHNEERHIGRCIDSIFASDPGAPLDVFVMANGCTDRTEDIVRQHAVRNPRVHLVSIQLGDKCNAWNVFIHDTVPTQCPRNGIYFFMDGDAQVMPGSFSAMQRVMQANQEANAVSAPPASGRSMRQDREELLRDRGLVANLYALRGSFVDRCREMGVRLPLGLEGDDGVVGALARWNLNPKNAMESKYIVPCPDAGFVFASFSLLRPSDWRAYWKRMVRYGRRRYEFKLLAPRLKAGGVAAIPADIRDIYVDAGHLQLKWEGIYTITNWLALREMRLRARRVASPTQ
jgi:glycosyltransferase involved in cell wall biosynthesis